MVLITCVAACTCLHLWPPHSSPPVISNNGPLTPCPCCMSCVRPNPTRNTSHVRADRGAPGPRHGLHRLPVTAGHRRQAREGEARAALIGSDSQCHGRATCRGPALPSCTCTALLCQPRLRGVHVASHRAHHGSSAAEGGCRNRRRAVMSKRAQSRSHWWLSVVDLWAARATAQLGRESRKHESMNTRRVGFIMIALHYILSIPAPSLQPCGCHRGLPATDDEHSGEGPA